LDTFSGLVEGKKGETSEKLSFVRALKSLPHFQKFVFNPNFLHSHPMDLRNIWKLSVSWKPAKVRARRYGHKFSSPKFKPAYRKPRRKFRRTARCKP